MNNNIKKIYLIIGDILVMYASLYLTLSVRYLKVPGETEWSTHLTQFTIIFLIWILIFYIANLYNLYTAINDKNFFKNTSRSILIAVFFSVVYFYTNPDINIAPKTNLFIFVVIFWILFIIWRRFFNWSLNSYLPKKNIAIIGHNKQVSELIQTIKKNPHLGFWIKLIFSPLNKDNVDGIYNTNNLLELKNKIVNKKITTIVLASDPHHLPELRSYLFSCLHLKITFISLPKFYEEVTGKIPIEAINQMWFLENLNEGNKEGFDLIKRIADFLGALIIFFITLIFWPIIGLIIKLESKGPVFFKQTRVGKDGKNFTIIKFRTMSTENNTYSPTSINDNRITKFGRFMRKTRIDEIPQILNILFSDMSFVGPRPERPELMAELEKAVPFYKERMLVKPGLTGWDQVSGEYHSPSRSDTLKKLQYDLFYIKNRSVYLDIIIALKTISTVLSSGGR